MNENRRNFIRKSASLAAAISVTGLSSYAGPGKNPGDAGYTGLTYNVAYAKAMMQAVASL